MKAIIDFLTAYFRKDVDAALSGLNKAVAVAEKLKALVSA